MRARIVWFTGYIQLQHTECRDVLLIILSSKVLSKKKKYVCIFIFLFISIVEKE